MNMNEITEIRIREAYLFIILNIRYALESDCACVGIVVF